MSLPLEPVKPIGPDGKPLVPEIKDGRISYTNAIDPVCAIHGKRMSEHDCLYCCLCFKPLTPEECFVNKTGVKEDVCIECGTTEQRMNTQIESFAADLAGRIPEMAKDSLVNNANLISGLLYALGFGKNEPSQRFYYISYARRTMGIANWEFGGNCADIHPLVWATKVNEIQPYCGHELYRVISWQELSEDEYRQFKGIP